MIKLLLKKKSKLLKSKKFTDAEEMNSKIKQLMYQNIKDRKVNSVSGKWWNLVKYYTGKQQANAPVINFFCDEIKKHFTKVSTSLNYEEPIPLDTSTITPPELTLHQVYYSLLRIKKTVTGHDGIPYYLLKDNAHNLAEPFLKIYNNCIRTSVFPSIFKIAKICLKPKVGKVTSLDDLRPVAITPVLARHFERLIYDNFILRKYNSWLPPDQYGFRKNSSTQDLLIRLQHTCKAFDEVGFDNVRIISLDMSKAFDGAPHKLIIKKVSEILSMDPLIINLLTNFLTGRQQYGAKDNEGSQMRTTNSGVPQGTVLGPPCFNAAYSDQVVEAERYVPVKFAADNNQCVGGKNNSDDAQVVIRQISTWCSINNFVLNTSKSKEVQVLFSRSASVAAISGVKVEKELKIFGLHIDNSFSFKPHIEKFVKKLSTNVYLLLKLKQLGYDKSELELLYEALVKPHIFYGASAWGGTPAYLLNEVDAVQRRATRLEIIQTFTPVKKIIADCDRKLYEGMVYTPSHLLKDILPQRTCYSVKLRNRLPCSSSTQKGKYKNLFPNRLLRQLND